MIRISNLSKIYNNEIEAIKDISLNINDGDIYGIIGLSGAGKSTLVRCINLLEKPTSGTIEIDGIDLTKLNEKQLREKRKEISMIFQNFNLLNQKNCLDNVCLPLIISKVNKKDAEKRALELLDIVGIKDKAYAYPSQLSGGQQQRVAIARALATNPKVLLCDEATSALDPTTTAQILQLLKDINQKFNITIIIITHQMSVVESICKHVAILDDGIVAEKGEVSSVFSNPQSTAAKRLVFPEGYDDKLITSNENVRFIRVVFDGDIATSKPLVASMAVEVDVVASIVYASTKSIGGVTYGSLLLSVENDDETIKKALEYFTQNEVSAKEVFLNV
ncbi:MAG TPA: ATP-binding cassette domain-containing protein [Erysipelotrichaceae bacterium]|jgi:D-methionine transport system ATP-binding protein|nr:ATP-binding cassette domain-containing protein [Erysipelotrichia bacterium]HPX33009.1 ATP-binding cassette domain-containing protein [Erysipelotrichaceae bacterium]HQA85535.1 ATP-binding cassette domain-containing protein [Erysipelotrichaceae bacterium]